ncbi:MAG: serine aminopeptidase domain-containing protein [Allorhizobium sp.]
MPVTFLDTVGLFMPAAGLPSDIAVLFASPWGLEEMCTRKFWRVIADRLSEAGIASFRFDYPGTGDALEHGDFSAGLSVWEDSLVAASEQLLTLSGAKRLTVVSHGLGAVVAARAAPRIPTLEALVAMAPAVSGRFHLRELQLWSKLVDEGLGLSEAQRASEGVSIAGLTMPAEIAAEVRKSDLMALSAAPAAQCLVVKRPERPADEAFAVHLQGLGADVARLDYKGYDELVTNPSVAVIPETVVTELVDWISARRQTLDAAPLPSIPDATALMGDAYTETPVRFGEQQRLYGLLCEPIVTRRGATVLLLGTAYDRHAGWGRATVRMARDLARDGIASLRFDGANVADSPPLPGRGGQVLYNDGQLDDVAQALDFLGDRNLLPAVVAGRCSGAYLAFGSAVSDSRIVGAVVANPYVFVWDPRRDVSNALRFVPRSLDTYKARLFKAETFNRLRHGRIDVGSALKNIGKALGNRISHLTGPLPLLMPTEYALSRKVRAAFETLAARNTRLSLLYSAHDVGLAHFALHFRPDGAGLKRFANVGLTIIENADHNLTPAPARKAYFDAVVDCALLVENIQSVIL